MLYIESPSTNPHFNLALEQYAFENTPKGEPCLMLWQNDNAIIVGKHQNTVEEINGAYVREHGISVVRRLSGGGAVYHDLGNLNYTWIEDVGTTETLDLHKFCIPVAEALKAVGADVRISGRNDLTIDGKKISGNSQYIQGGRILHHGTLLFCSDLSVLGSALRVRGDKISSKGFKSIESRVTNIAPYLKQPMDMRAFWQYLVQALAPSDDTKTVALTKEQISEIRRIQKERYETWSWNYGRSPSYSICKYRKIEGVGQIELCMDVSNGIIQSFETHGDYFGNGDTDALRNSLAGCRIKEDCLRLALRQIDLDACYKNINMEQFIELLLC